MPDTLPTLSYDEALAKIVELTDELAQVREAHTRLRSTADDNYNRGREWKDMADKLQAQVKELMQQVEAERREANASRMSAAELRGYIRRVNELDPRRVRQRSEHKGQNPRDMSPRDLDAYLSGRR